MKAIWNLIRIFKNPTVLHCYDEVWSELAFGVVFMWGNLENANKLVSGKALID